MKNNKTNLNPLDQRIYKYWQALYLAFYSSRLYIDVGKRWRGWGLCYFFLVIAIASIPLSIKSMRAFNEYFNYEFLQPMEQIPSFEIKRGKLSFPFFMPYLIKNKYNDVSIIIDNQINLTEMNYIYPKWMMIITSDHISIRLPTLSLLPRELRPPTFATVDSQNIDTHSFKEIQYASFNGKMWIDQTNLVQTKWYLMIALYPTITMLLFGFFTIFLFFLAIMGRAFSYIIFKFKIDFKRIYRLMLVSSGAGISVFIMSLTYVQLPTLGGYLFLIITLYFFYAVLSLKRESKKMVLY